MGSTCHNCGAPITVFDNPHVELINEIKAIIKAETQPKGKDPWLDLNGVCTYSSLSKSTIRRACQQGILQHSKAVGKLMFKVSWVDKFLEGK